jgi:hypothetical protein
MEELDLNNHPMYKLGYADGLLGESQQFRDIVTSVNAEIYSAGYAKGYQKYIRDKFEHK